MARAFIKRAGGYNCITYETMWADIIPVFPPEGYERFYGPMASAASSSSSSA